MLSALLCLLPGCPQHTDAGLLPTARVSAEGPQVPMSRTPRPQGLRQWLLTSPHIVGPASSASSHSAIPSIAFWYLISGDLLLHSCVWSLTASWLQLDEQHLYAGHDWGRLCLSYRSKHHPAQLQVTLHNRNHRIFFLQAVCCSKVHNLKPLGAKLHCRSFLVEW